MDLVEWQRPCRRVDAYLHQRSSFAREVRLGAYPLRLNGLVRPDYERCFGGAQPFLDHVAISAVRRQLLVEPHHIAKCEHGPSLAGCRARVGDEDLGYL